MRAFTMIAAAAAMAVVAGQAFAMEAMMMKKGETSYMMPNGTMGTMPMMDAKMSAEMMKHAKPMDHCVMMMMGEDGKMYVMEDMKMADGKMACDSMSMTK